ncbi:DNA-binding protein [Candidatus Atribacteria bacterium 1244-E10-H5-B2]|nr:MAG: DNA-binding protein [Candidatus Atribacteria bacterium 1244-E10-H5-B2]
MKQGKNIYPSRKIRGISFFTTDQLVDILGLSMLTIRRYLKKEKIKAVKVGQRWYISSKNLDKFLSGKE